MATFTFADATAASELLASWLVDRNDQLHGFNDNPVVPSDDEAESPCPFFDTFYDNEGSKSIEPMIIIDPTHFEMI